MCTEKICRTKTNLVSVSEEELLRRLLIELQTSLRIIADLLEQMVEAKSGPPK